MNAGFHRALVVDKHFGYSAYKEKNFIALVCSPALFRAPAAMTSQMAYVLFH